MPIDRSTSSPHPSPKRPNLDASPPEGAGVSFTALCDLYSPFLGRRALANLSICSRGERAAATQAIAAAAADDTLCDIAAVKVVLDARQCAPKQPNASTWEPAFPRLSAGSHL